MSRLSPRQAQIAGMIADGKSIEEIATDLGTKYGTVVLQLIQIRRKKGLKSNGELSAYVWKKRMAAQKTYSNNDRPAT